MPLPPNKTLFCNLTDSVHIFVPEKRAKKNACSGVFNQK
ncbi:hypothetical protein CHK_1829 [Christensenella hongkongensis]|uniref:Uncharacterized protein n=1 Tax=Christensenella hongkongensis TaxID=270498 RepID=A0A0M2NDW5_9FIRM|nr:hypothetical protein CHK_1829 [Christensenella hongkongensis]